MACPARTSQKQRNGTIFRDSNVIQALPFRWAFSLCSGSALLLILSFPYTRLSGLSLVALVPLMLALRGQGAARGLALGGWHGFLFQSYIMFWANFFGPPAYLFLAGYKTVLPALFGAAWGWLSRRRPNWFPFGFLVGWLALEYLQTFGPFGVTWGMLSHAWARYPALLQICSVAGPWALSLVVLLVNVACFVSLPPRGARGAWLGAAIAAILATLGFGQWRLGQAQENPRSLAVGAVQVNMGREVKWDPAYAEFALKRLELLTCQASEKGARLILWPETAIPYRGFLKSPVLNFEIGMLGLTTKSYVVVGSIEKVGDAAGHTLNTASLVTPKGAFEGRYDKQRLVPGGEYLPLEEWLRPYPIFDRVMRYQPGSGDGIFALPEAPQPTRAGMLICFESMVPYLAAERVQKGAEILLVATNDGWFGENSAIQHHFEMAIFRAVEQGCPVLQCGNTGVSGLIDEWGRVQQETAINQETVLTGQLGLRRGLTWYARIGDSLVQLALALFLLCLGLAKGSEAVRGRKST